MTSVTIDLDEEEVKILNKRAKKNFLTLREQVEDIIRMSCIRSKSAGTKTFKTDDKLVEVFSRENKGPKPKKKSRAS